jgi:hypothetical protein
MSWTDPNESVFEDNDVLSQANLLTSVLNNLTHLGRGARVFHSIAQATSSGVPLSVTFDSERYDLDGFHSIVTNPERLTVPSGADGRYLIGGCVAYASSVTADLSVRLNGTTSLVFQFQNGGTQLSINTVYDLVAGDYVELRALQATGAVNISSAGNWTPEFWIQGVGGT